MSRVLVKGWPTRLTTRTVLAPDFLVFGYTPGASARAAVRRLGNTQRSSIKTSMLPLDTI